MALRTLFIGQTCIRLNEVDSTNNYTAGLLRQSVIHEGTAVLAQNQTSGRGQRGNTWESEHGKNLCMSILLTPTWLNPSLQFCLNKMVALVVSDYLIDIGLGDVNIKWPNDVLVKGKKISGILLESSIRTDAIQNTITGIGLNVNQLQFNNFGRPATSIALEIGRKLDVNIVFEEICNRIEPYYLQLKSNCYCLDKLYLNRLFKYNEPTKFVVNDIEFIGVISGVETSGMLLVETETGSRKYNFQEIKMVE